MRSLLLEKHDAGIARARDLMISEFGAVSGGCTLYTVKWKPETNDWSSCHCDCQKPVQDPGDP